MGQPACSLGRMMKAHWWTPLLGLFCIPSVVNLSVVSQSPALISHVRVNSSFEITCTSQLEPVGLRLYRYFSNKEIGYLYFHNGDTKKTIFDPEFGNRITVTPVNKQKGLGFKVKLSLLDLSDTDLYCCKWIFFNMDSKSSFNRESNGTIIIVRDNLPQNQCKGNKVYLILVSLGIAVAAVVFLLVFLIRVSKCLRFKKQFIPARPSLPPPRPPRPDRPQHIFEQQQTPLQCHYLITSTDVHDFRFIQGCSKQEQDQC